MPHGGDIYTNKVNMDFSVNLNPFMLRELLKEALLSAADNVSYYPDPDQRAVRELIGRTDKLQPEKIIAGNGASELIMAVVRAVRPENILLIEPCFSGYRHALASLNGCRINEYHLKEEDGFYLNETVLECIKEETDMIFLTDPWNPTGKNIREDLLEKILQRAELTDTAVILDQSFLLMSDAWMRYFDADRLTDKYENLYIIRSFTKIFACPGVRIGYVAVNKKNIENVIKNLPEWNLSVTAESIVMNCLPHICNEIYIKRLNDLIKEERTYMADELNKMNITAYDSDTAFILIRSDIDLYDELLKKEILIRDCKDYRTLKNGFFRLAVKTHEENKKLMDAIGRIKDGY